MTARTAGLSVFCSLLLIGCGGDDAPESTVPATEATVSAREVAGYGDALVTADQVPVYVLTADPEGGSSCTGKCAEEWPPLTAEGEPTAGPGADQSKLSTFEREDGTVQVLYDGHALYTHGERASASWAGTESDGGIWYLVSPDGEPIEATESGGY